MSAEAFPLYWPDGWPRTADWKRESDSKFGGKVHGLTMGRTRDQLFDELGRLGAKSIVVSTNAGGRDLFLRSVGQTIVPERNVAVYFVLKNRPMVMARDSVCARSDDRVPRSDSS